MVEVKHLAPTLLKTVAIGVIGMARPIFAPVLAMAVSPLAGKPADPSTLVNLPKLVTAYFTERPDPTPTFSSAAF